MKDGQHHSRGHAGAFRKHRKESPTVWHCYSMYPLSFGCCGNDEAETFAKQAWLFLLLLVLTVKMGHNAGRGPKRGGSSCY